MSEEIQKSQPAVPIIVAPAPQVMNSPEELKLFACPNCGGIHFRHAGYVETLTPFMDSESPSVRVASDDKQVKVCVSCKHSYVMSQGKIWDVTKFIDLEAWAKTEKIAQEATGPGGEC